MDEECGWLKKYYRQYLKRFKLARTTVTLGKNAIWRLRQGLWKQPTWHCKRKSEESEAELRFAVICDHMTWVNFDAETNAIRVRPDNWREVLESFRPDVLFTETAWLGSSDHEWEGRIYHDRSVYTDNRFILKDILRYCRQAGITTVFWNKEDTQRQAESLDNFIDTALLFDHILTTTKERIPVYHRLGHKSVHLMMFGYSEKVFPLELSRTVPKNPNCAVFLGSWYGGQPERSADMMRMFDWVLDQGLELEIYDRLSAEDKPDRQYPERYRPYIHQGVPYEDTGQVMAGAGYVININSVRDSQTMFARRVFEAMACGRMIISNESMGMRELFPGRIWFVGEARPTVSEKVIIEENMKVVREKFTFKKQLCNAMGEIGFPMHFAEKKKEQKKL